MASKRSRESQENQTPSDVASRSPADFAKVGPRSLEGVEAGDLPDGGRGDVSTDPNREAGRKLPQQTGEWESGDTGLRGEPDVADAREHGRSRKRS